MSTLSDKKDQKDLEKDSKAVQEENLQETVEEGSEEASDKTADDTVAANTETSEEAADTEENDEEATGPGDAQEKDGKFFKKARKTDKKNDKLQEKIDELEDKVKRQMAEFDNFRKRSEKEKAAMFETGAKSVIEKILPIVDNFERGLSTIPEGEKGSPFAEGMSMVYKQFLTELEKLEVKPIEAVGKEFNPDFHNAVMQVESKEYASGIVAQELQKGYTYRDSVVRHSMVAVVP